MAAILTVASCSSRPFANSKNIDMTIPQNIIEELVAQARAEAPDESCGYLLGIVSPSEGGGQGEALVTENYPMENVDHSPEHFSFAPRDQFAALRYARERGLKILANRHSHPASPSRPSQEDLRLANDPSIRYAILSLQDDRPVLNSFRILSGQVVDTEHHL